MIICEHGHNCIIDKSAVIGKNLKLGHNVLIGRNVIIGNDVFIDSNTIIRDGVHLGSYSRVGSNCIIGEYGAEPKGNDFSEKDVLSIGEHAIIRSSTTLYAGSSIGDYFQTGHYVMVRESSEIGNHVSVGNYSDIQGKVKIGNYVRFHSNDRIEQYSCIDDYVWIFPGVELTNDPTPPSEELMGVHVHSFAIISAQATIVAGCDIASDSLVGAGAVVTKDVKQFEVVVGNPAHVIADVRDVRHKKTGKQVYPWREYFSREMPWHALGYNNWLLKQNEYGE